MNVVRLDSATDLLQHAGAFLTEAEAHNCLILGLSAVLATKPDAYGAAPPLFAVVEEAERVQAAVLQTPPFRLVLSLAHQPEALEAMATHLHAAGASLPGVVGPAPASAEFAALWHQHTGLPFYKKVAERTYQLDRVNAVRGVPGRLRRASEADRQLMLEWMAAFNAETFGEIDPVLAERSVSAMLTMPPAVRGAFLWDDGGPVSLTGYSGPTPNGIRIGPVYTPPALRGQGYASAGVAGASQALLDSGRRFVFLFTDLANPTSNHIYQVIGYRPVCDADEYVFEATPS